jgi:hypothetical protein
MFQKLKKNEYFCIFLSLPIFSRFFPDLLPILTIRCFRDPGDFFHETIFTTLQQWHKMENKPTVLAKVGVIKEFKWLGNQRATPQQ